MFFPGKFLTGVQESFPPSGKFVAGVQQTFPVTGRAVAGVQEAFRKAYWLFLMVGFIFPEFNLVFQLLISFLKLFDALFVLFDEFF